MRPITICPFHLVQSSAETLWSHSKSVPIPDTSITKLQRHKYHAPVHKGLKTNDFKRLKLTTLYQWPPNWDFKKIQEIHQKICVMVSCVPILCWAKISTKRQQYGWYNSNWDNGPPVFDAIEFGRLARLFGRNVGTYHTTWHHIQPNCNHNIHQSKHLISYYSVHFLSKKKNVTFLPAANSNCTVDEHSGVESRSGRSSPAEGYLTAGSGFATDA